MKKHFLSFILPLTVMVACEKAAVENDAPIDHKTNIEFEAESAIFEQASKTSLSENNHILWMQGDELTIFSKSFIGDRYQLKEGHDSSKGIFSFVSTPNENKGAQLSSNIAVYPYSPDYTLNYTMNAHGEVYTVENVLIPSTQYYTANSMSPSSYPMIAVSDNTSLKFKNICGLLKLQLKGKDKVLSIVVEGKDQEILAGKGSVKAHAIDIPALTMSLDGAKQVKLDCGNGVQLTEVPTNFYIALAPTDFIKGFTIKVKMNNGIFETFNAPATAENRITRNNILRMPVLNVKSITDLSTDVTANCYVVNKPGIYKFKANVKGNSTTEQIKIAADSKAETLWESFGDESAINPGDLLKDVKIKDGYIQFEVVSPFKQGNASIGITDADGTVLWSWHIWLIKDNLAGGSFNNGAVVVMDRNLGALSTSYDNPLSEGLLYQWGRKDPIASRNVKATVVFDDCYTGEGYSGLRYSIENPYHFLLNTSNYNANWLFPSDDTLWGITKTMYDPCPAGWKVPTSDNDSGLGVLIAASKNSPNLHIINSEDNQTLEFPVNYWRDKNGYHKSSTCHVWTSTTSGTYAWQVHNSNSWNKSSKNYRYEATAVRCVKE